MNKLFASVCIASAFMSSAVFAGDAEIIATFEKLGLSAKEIKIMDTPVKGIKSVSTPSGPFYVSDDGIYLIQGSIYDMRQAQPENIANSSNLNLIKSIDKDAIVYKAKNEKYIIYVFTDYTCSYCKVLHEQVDKYNELGISIHYFAFPRNGMNSEVANNMQSIWSTKDRKTAFDNAYKGKSISPANSMVPYVQMQFDVGRQIGFSGTPAIILPTGQLLAGYVPPEELIKILEQ